MMEASDEMMPAHGIKALVFDAYGTIFDLEAVASACQNVFPARGSELSRLWRAKQLEYCWLCSAMGRYRDFWQLTEWALMFACQTLNLPCEPAIRAGLLNAYLQLKPYPDARPALEGLATLPLAILSNGTRQMLQAAVTSAGLGNTFDHVVSVDDVKVYKPGPRAYQLAAEKLGLDKTVIGFVSSNCWDVLGAKAFGFWTCWVNRSQVPVEELALAPDSILPSLTALPERLVLGG